MDKALFRWQLVILYGRCDNLCFQKIDVVCFISNTVEKAIFGGNFILPKDVIGFSCSKGICFFEQVYFLPYARKAAILEGDDKPPLVGSASFKGIIVGVQSIGLNGDR